MGSLSNDMQKTIQSGVETVSKALDEGVQNGGDLVNSMSDTMVGLGTTSTTVSLIVGSIMISLRKKLNAHNKHNINSNKPYF